MPNNVSSATSGNDSTSPLLDSTFFPHIMDMIIRYAPYRSLLALRATNRTFKQRVDELLMDHVVIDPWDDTHVEANINDIFLTKNELQRLPELKNNISSVDGIRVLDMVGSLPYRLRVQILRGSIPPLYVPWLRTRASSWFELEEDEVDSEIHVHFLLDSTPHREPLGSSHVVLPPSVVQVGINLEHDCIDLARNPSLELYLVRDHDDTPMLEELVFICRPPTATTATASLHRRCIAADHSPAKVQGGLAEFIARVATQYWKAVGCGLTLVGFPLECLAPQLWANHALGAPPPSTEDVRLAFIEQMYDLSSWPALRKGRVYTVVDELEIIDHETYRRRVGEEAYRLQTVW